MDIVSIIRQLAIDNNISMNQLCYNAELSATNINHKLQRDSLYFSDVEKILAAINLHLKIVPNNFKNN